MSGMILSETPGTATSLVRAEGPLTFEQMELRELALAKLLPTMDDIAAIEEERRKIAALEHYLEGKQAHLPARGAQRRLEARIGQLLGEPENHGPATVRHDERLVDNKTDRHDFRILARALDGKVDLTKDDWRQSRRALVALIRERTTEESETMTMTETVQPAPMPPVHGVRITLPDGLTAEQTCRKAMALEEAGATPDDAAARAGLTKGATYAKMRDVVMLADRGNYSERDQDLVARALETMNETAQVGAAWKMVEPVARRVWGEETRGGPKRDLDRRRLDKFEHAFAMLMQACETGTEIDVPYLSRARARDSIAQLAEAAAQLHSLSNRIQELYP